MRNEGKEDEIKMKSRIPRGRRHLTDARLCPQQPKIHRRRPPGKRYITALNYILNVNRELYSGSGTMTMIIEEAIHKVKRMWGKGTSGRVMVDGSGIYRCIKPCRLCEGTTLWGTITVRHEDGRTVSFNPRLFHYVEAGHPVTNKDINGDLLIAIIADG